MYATYKDGVFRECAGNIVFSPTVYQTAESLTEEQRAELGVYNIVDDMPVLQDGNQWSDNWTYEVNGTNITRTWYQEPMPPEQISAIIESKIDQLWRAADEYVSSYISGVAIGLLTLGTIQQKPKALAITAWSSSVWDEYYRRKALVTASSEVDTDFSVAGPMPHSVPELRAELGM